MINKQCKVILILMSFLLCSCSKDNDHSTSLFLTESPLAGDSVNMATIDSNIEFSPEDVNIIELFESFPKSNIDNPLGNHKGYSSIVFNSKNDRYYFFQNNYWNYEKHSPWGDPNNHDYATQDVLARINTMDSALRNREVVSDFVIKDLKCDDGRIFCLSEGNLVEYTNDFDKIILKQNEIDDSIENFVVSEGFLYYTMRVKKGLFRLSVDQPSLEPEKIIQGKIQDFQVIGEIVLYANEDGILQYINNQVKQIYKHDSISNFLFDGILLYKDKEDTLRNVANEKIISENVLSYSIYGDFVFYSTESGLYKYDLNQSSEELLLVNSEKRMLTNFQIYNNQLFLDFQFKRYSPDSMNCIYVYELDSKDLKPLVQIRNDETQKYFCKELGYEISYPVGFILQFDPGSYYGGYALFSNPTNNTFIRVKYSGDYSGYNDRVLEGIKFKTNEGVNGAYSIDNVDDRGLQINGVLENKFIFEANGDIDETMEIFLDMMKSLRGV